MQQDANPIFDSVITQKLFKYFQQGYDERVFDLFISPHGGDSEQTPEAATYPLCDRIIHKLKNSAHRSHLVLGDSGLGKTTISLWLTREIWKDLKTFRRIPLYIHLPQITKTPQWEERLLQNYLQQIEIGLDDKERHQLMSFPLLIIIDGLDEIKLRPDFNLYKLNGWGIPPHDIKVVSCCRPEALRHYSLPVLFEAPGQNVPYPYYATYYLQLFQDAQIKPYLQQFSQHLPEPLAIELANTPWAQSGEIYHEWLTRIPSLKSLAENPFLLSLIAQALPRIVQQHSHQSSVLQPHFTRNSVFAAFVDQWFSYQAKRLQKDRKLLALTEDQLIGYLKAYAKNLAASLLDAEGRLILELLDDTQTLKPALAEPNEDPLLLAHYETQGKQIFADLNALQALRIGCLLHTHNGKFKFLHKSLIEYLAAQLLFTGLKGEFEAYQQMLMENMRLNRQRLDEIKIIQSLAEHVKTDEAFCALLGDIVLASKDTPGLATAATNAITILNAAGINFSHHDFRDIQISGADLSGAICYQTDFRGANLTGVRFHQAFLSGARLEGANITDVHFGEKPFINVEQGISTSALYQDISVQPPITYLLVGGFNGRIYQFNIETGQLVAHYDHSYFFGLGAGIDTMVKRLAVHSPRALLISEGNNFVKLWSLQARKKIQLLPIHIGCVAFDPEGKNLATGGDYNGTIHILDVNSRQPRKTLHGHTNAVWCLVFHPDGTRLASGSQDNTVRLWNVETGQLLKTFSGHSNTVTCVGFDLEGKYLASGSRDHTVRLWDVSNGHTLQTLQDHSKDVWSIAFHPNGMQLASGSEDNTVRLWEVTTGRLQDVLQGHTKEINYVMFHPSGKYLVSCGIDGSIRYWDLASYLKQLNQDYPLYMKAVHYMALSADGRFVAGSNNNTICVWDVTTGQLLQTLLGHSNTVTCMVFDLEGKRLASGGQDNTIRLWNVSNGHTLQTLQAHSKKITCIAFDKEGKRLASGGEDNTIYLWDVVTGQRLLTMHGHTRWWNRHSHITCAVFHPDGTYLAVGNIDSTVQLWEVSTGHLIQTLELDSTLRDIRDFTSGDMNQRISCITFDPTGDSLVWGYSDGVICLWDLKKKQFSYTCQGDSRIKSIIYHSDGRVFISISNYDQNVLHLWEAASGRCLLRLQMWYQIKALIFSHNNLFIVGEEGYLSMWELHTSNQLRLRWSTRPSPRLFLEGTNLTQCVGISERNQQLGIQRGTTGQPASTNQRYQAWCSLFQPLQGTASISSHFAMIGTPHQRLKMTESIWVVSVARRITPNSSSASLFSLSSGNPLHVFLVIEGVKRHRRFIIRAELTSPDSHAVTIELTPLDDFQRFQASVKQYEANQWNITAEDGIKLLKNIQTDQQTCLTYSMTGNRSILTTFFSNSLGKEFHSCVSWCEKQLGLIGIHFPHQWYHLFALPPSDLTLPSNHSNLSRVLPILKT